MGSYETFDHTADVGLRIRAESLDDLFATAAQALMDHIVVNRSDVRPVEIQTVELNATTLHELLLAWLNELIFRCETQRRLFSQIEPTVHEAACQLVAQIAGEPIDPTRHVLDHEVKAATHHGATVAKVGKHWLAEIILDI